NVHHASIIQFNSVLESYGSKSGLRYAYRYYSSDDHGSVPLISEYDGLRFIFAGYKLEFGKALASPTYVTDHFAQLSSMFGYQVRPSERMIDQLAHIAIGRDTTIGIAYFQLNADLYPNSAKAYDGLGDAWRAKGDTKKATTFYEKSLSLNPKNQHATAMIQKMKEAKD